jgi:hypothetical protein
LLTDTSFAIADLQSHWYTLDDLDRAQAIKLIHLSGVSHRDPFSRSGSLSASHAAPPFSGTTIGAA